MVSIMKEGSPPREYVHKADLQLSEAIAEMHRLMDIGWVCTNNDSNEEVWHKIISVGVRKFV